MKSLIKLKPKVGIWMQDVPMPICGINDVLIKIHKTAICGTDIHIYSWDNWARATIQTPLIIGHEFCGEIVEVGSAVKTFIKGQKVSAEGHITCGTCRNCRSGRQHLCCKTYGIGVNRTGCFAEYLAMPASNVVVLPENITADEGAILDPLGNAIHCALAFDVTGEDVLVTGAGPIGLMAVAILRHIGARHIVITDVNDYRLNIAKKMGVTKAINVKQQSIAEAMDELGIQEGFAVGLEMSGNPNALRAMIQAMNNGGCVALLGIPPNETNIDWNVVIFKGLVLKGIYGREMYETWYKMLSLLQSGLNIKPVMTHHFSVNEFQDAFQVMASGNSGKVILDWQ